MCHGAAEALSHNHMPCACKLFVECLLHQCGDILFDAPLLQQRGILSIQHHTHTNTLKLYLHRTARNPDACLKHSSGHVHM